MRRLSFGRKAPWVCIGDFNEILHKYEKKGKLESSTIQIQLFREAVKDAELCGLGFKRPAFTWYNVRKARKAVWERMDRALANEKWKELFPIAQVTHEVVSHSDYCPIVLK